ncbi:hypothetical protein PL9214290202 [Planktothrix tepida PCC 9214]|uniref:Uncharacterized protein n=1 Tax=Planktothrix tepida PCC 9214 TaxID=671072 RepID=A0A1J1LFD0_9CYAN|nr:hypothetical protein PL9214290202 [Planktothrix tepida PCC 9214]
MKVNQILEEFPHHPTQNMTVGIPIKHPSHLILNPYRTD